MGRSASFLTFLCIFLLTSVGLSAAPAQLAEAVRGELADAQLQLMLSPDLARLPLERAEQAYAALALQGLPTPNRIQGALGRAAQAVQNGDEAAFAAAKA